MRQIVDDLGAEKFRLLQLRLVDDHLDALGLDALHHPLDAGVAEVIRTALHDQPMEADHIRLTLEDALGDEVLARSVGVDDGPHDVLRHILVVGQQLLGILGQAVAAIAERGVVVMVSDAGIETDALDDVFAVQTMGGGVGIEFIEVRHAHGKVSICEQLDRLGLGGVGKQHRDILLDGALPEQVGKDCGALGALADDDARRMQVVVQCRAFTQEFRREDEVVAVELRPQLGGVADRDGGFKNHDRFRVDGHDVLDHRFDRAGVEVVGLGVVVGGGGDDDIVGPGVSVMFIERSTEIERPVCQIVLDLGVGDRRHLAVEHLDFLGDDIERHYFIVLRQ